MFLGTYHPRLDAKGRLVLPAKFREKFEQGLVLTRGQERCLYVFTLEEFERIHSQLRQSSVASKSSRDYIRVFLSGASDEVPDKQGRITIPPLLRSYALLTGELAFIGAGNRAEIWDSQAWDDYLAEQEIAFAETDAEIIPGM
ncbi:division/cell wall cluster transcriptional repressor MraZ [Rothia sp. ZJ1223]|uniref:division/cell wall cluster transcriptional repressor MraZ n=1 Tax=Rothia sp. ZJ1223 TaxID=2811098 RepID=UPI0019598F49|nr:division/cell wall cluster transcriptional repressor MraZ [Rothia sp. ZJ1223]MBM7050766.1 division/cell wall cluster transcriptional repressor MraZ [Rothia sp. ZJ1223]